MLRLGESAELTLETHAGAFEQGVTEFDLGDGVAVAAVTVPGGVGAVAELSVSVEETAETGVRDIEATTADETVVSERMLTLLVPTAETCDQAFELPGEGLYHGVLAGGVNDYWDLSTCTGHLAEGPDSVFAVELGDAQILSATLYHQGVDAVLYLADDCAAIESPLTCSDIGGIDVAEFVSFVPDVGAGGTFFLVVDSYGEIPVHTATGFSLSISIYDF